MSETEIFTKQVRKLIDDLKSVCANYGLGNDGNEFKIITQIFLYKFLHDKFIKEIKDLNKEIKESSNWENKLHKLTQEEYEILTMQLNESTAIIKPNQLISSLFSKQNDDNFADIFDKTLLGIAKQNNDLFSVFTGGGEKISLFENLSKYVSDNRDEFCKAMVNKLVSFSFENIFGEGFDFFSTIFEYLVKDYNSDSGGKYAEYFTPHTVSKIIACCLVPDNSDSKISNVTCYDPSAGSGTLLMNLANQIGEDKCTIFSQDISQKSSNLLRLNLILNNLVHSIHNHIQGNTLIEPAHKENDFSIKVFDYVVSNPPFKLDFSDFRDELFKKENNDRFFAGIPKVPNKKKEAMAIYLVFIQHVIYSLSDKGKAAIVVPTGFITSQNGIAKNIRKKLVKDRILEGVISMPSNIFANTGTNVSIIFINKIPQDKVILIDASNLGEKIKEGKNQKTVLSKEDVQKIVENFTKKNNIKDFSVQVDLNQLIEKSFSFSAGQYFNIEIEYEDISNDEFKDNLNENKKSLNKLFSISESLKREILEKMEDLNLE